MEQALFLPHRMGGAEAGDGRGESVGQVSYRHVPSGRDFVCLCI